MEHNWKIGGKRLKELRKRKGFTSASSLADAIGEKMNPKDPVSPKRQKIEGWEKGNPIHKIDELLALCDILDCDPWYLTGSQEHQKHKEYTGLSDKAIERLHHAAINESPMLDVLSVLIEHENALETMAIYALDSYSGKYTFIPYDREDGKKEILDHEMIDRANKLYILDAIIEVLDNYRKQQEETKNAYYGKFKK